MKKVLVTLFVVIVILTGLIAGAYLYYHNNADHPMKDPTKVVSITIDEDDSLFFVLDKLEQDGTLSNGWLSKAFYRLSGLNLEIEPGRHEVPAGGSLKDLLEALQGKNLDERTFTIPEGFTIDNMADRIEKSGLVTKPEFIQALVNFDAPSYVPELGKRRYRMEGFLKPDTYTFALGTPARDIIQAMSNEFSANMARIIKSTGKTKITPADYDVIINKAAMIERETNNSEEREIVASVIENRLKIDMKLQLDATILYARGVDQKVITMDDILFENPFNTYSVKGLPAGPIANPSDESIRAALAPKDTIYLYYVLNPRTGKHFFTDNYSEFEAKRAEYSGNPVSTKPATSEATQPVDTTPANPYEGPSGIPFSTTPKATTPTSTTPPATAPGTAGTTSPYGTTGSPTTP